MKDWIKVTLITLLVITILIFIMIPILDYQSKLHKACEELGGDIGNTGLCYKENNEGIMEGYKIMKLGGEYKLIRK